MVEASRKTMVEAGVEGTQLGVFENGEDPQTAPLFSWKMMINDSSEENYLRIAKQYCVFIKDQTLGL